MNKKRSPTKTEQWILQKKKELSKLETWELNLLKVLITQEKNKRKSAETD